MTRPLLRPWSLLLATICLLIAACSFPNHPATPSLALKVATDTSTAPLAMDLLNDYEIRVPGLIFTLVQGNLEMALAAVRSGEVDLALVSAGSSVRDQFNTPIAWNVLAVIVHSDNPVNNLARDDLRATFSGQVLSWDTLGGERWPVHVITREYGSGARLVFQELVLDEQPFSLNAELATSNTQAIELVSSNPTALGYVTLQAALQDGGVKILMVDGIPATLATARSKDYRLVMSVYFVTQDEPIGTVRAFLEWILSTEGQAVVRNQHIGLND